MAKSAPNKSDQSKIATMVKGKMSAGEIAKKLNIKEESVEAWVEHFSKGGGITGSVDKIEKPKVNK